MKKTKNNYLRIGIALVLLFNPNIHIIDFLPDFIAYFILFSVLSEAAGLSPHFSEARDAAKRLAILGLFKIPAAFLVITARSNNTADANLIPTFAIVFALFEIILGYTFVFRISEGLFYLGERTDASALISPFHIKTSKNADSAASRRFLLYRSQQPEVLRNLSVLFIFVKAICSFLPEFLLLTRKQDFVGDTAGQNAFLRLYPYALIIAVLLTLLVGIYWLLLSRAYMREVRNEGRFLKSLHKIAGDALIEKKEKHELCAAYVLGFTLIFISTLFSLSFMPILGYTLFLFIGGCWIRTKGWLRHAIRIIGTGAILSSLALNLMIKIFEYDFGYQSLLNDSEAMQAYAPCVIIAAINTALLLFLLALIFLAIHRVIYGTLGLSPKSERYGRTEKSFHRSLSVKNLILFLIGAASVICRGIYVYLRGQVIYIPSSATSIGTISHKMEFWPLILMAIAIPYILYTFYYMGVMKDEIKLALDEEE